MQHCVELSSFYPAIPVKSDLPKENLQAGGVGSEEFGHSQHGAGEALEKRRCHPTKYLTCGICGGGNVNVIASKGLFA